MCATHNSVVRQGLQRGLGLTLALGIGFAPSLTSARAEDDSPRAAPARLAQAQRAFVEAQRRYLNEPTNHLAAWEFARATFERGEFSTNDTERATLAVQGIDASRRLVARDPKSAPGHYYLGMNLGQMARTKLLGALKIVDEMEREFKTAAALDEQVDRAGPDRSLGLLYLEAPVLGSVGSRTKARKHFERAAELTPDFPENRLNLAEAYLKWREKKPLRRELDELEKLWPRARTNYAGPDWQAEWLDWSKRIQMLRQKAEAVLKP